MLRANNPSQHTSPNHRANIQIFSTLKITQAVAGAVVGAGVLPLAAGAALFLGCCPGLGPRGDRGSR